MRLILGNDSTFLLKLIVTTKFSRRVSSWLFQQNIAVAMALALVWEARNMFPAITKGRKEISPTELNTTGNWSWQLDGLASIPQRVWWKSVPVSLQLAHRGSVWHGHQSPFPPNFILVFMNENSWLPWGIRMPERTKTLGEKTRENSGNFFHRVLWIHAPIQQPSHPLVSWML